jgi:hypothetical protein
MAEVEYSSTILILGQLHAPAVLPLEKDSPVPIKEALNLLGTVIKFSVVCGQSSWLQIQRSRVRFQELPDFLRSKSGTGFTQPRGYK